MPCLDACGWLSAETTCHSLASHAQQRRVGGGNTDVGAVFPLSTERQALMHKHPSNSSRVGEA